MVDSVEIEIREIMYGSLEYHQEIRLRSKILREPLGLQFRPDELAGENKDIHLGAFSGTTLLGCLLLSPQANNTMRVRQVAVDANTQGRGIGRKLVEYSEQKASSLGFTELYLKARLTAVPFYLKLGYSFYDEPFEEVTIPHRKMRKTIH